MREQLLILTLVAVAGYGAEAPPFCPAWSADHDRFREQTVYFQSGSALVTAKAKEQISEVANYLKAHPSTAARIEGNCDDRGSEEHNRWLGDRCARAVAKELTRLGVASERIDTISFGEDRPADPGHSAKARQKNRRAAFVLLSPPVPEDPSAHNQTLHSTPR